MRTSSLAFFPDGRLAVGTLPGDIWIVSGINEDLNQITCKVLPPVSTNPGNESGRWCPYRHAIPAGELLNFMTITTTEKQTFTKLSLTRTNRTKVGMHTTSISKLAMMGPFITDAPVGSATGRYLAEWSRYLPTERLPR